MHANYFDASLETSRSRMSVAGFVAIFLHRENANEMFVFLLLCRRLFIECSKDWAHTHSFPCLGERGNSKNELHP